MSHTIQAVLGIAIALGLGFVTTKIGDWQRDAEPVENWVEMKSIYVPDFPLDELNKAVVIADINRKEPFTSVSTVTAIPVVENQEFFCFGELTNDNVPGEELPKTGIPFSQIFKEPCKWYPGEFKIKIALVLHREGYNMKTASWETPVFRVLPEGALSYVPQEQIKQLEEVKEKVQQLEEVVK